ncbi:hypothetical protein [Vibrio sp. Hal054]|uniref:hypothetical protein n=1 Tax=Vibrio sp. Hal054 TaxID=3035158 RepID=UPI00301E24A8
MNENKSNNGLSGAPKTPIDPLALLDEYLRNTTPEELYAELSSYEAVGPKAIDFLPNIHAEND